MKIRITLLAIATVICACTAPEVLAPRDGTVPAGVNFSGTWNIQSDPRADTAAIRDAIRKTDGVKDDDLFRRPDRQTDNRGRRSRRSGVKGGLVDVFLELGELLKVTQTADGLFISFDRSVVEEYRFGENRLASVGEVRAQRVTGWEGSTLVIETLDRNEMKMTERFRLLDDDSVLERTITFRSKKDEEATIVQTFLRR